MQRTFDVVMLAEDRQHHTELANYLDAQGYGVRVISTGKELLDMIGQEPVDMLLLSVTRPDADTAELIGQIRGNPDWEHVGVTMLSSADTLPQVLEALQHGADDFIIEPYNSAVMDAKINSVVARKARRSADQARLRKIEHVAEQMEHIALRLGIELAAETDFDKLVQKIVETAISICNTAGGAFYIRTNEDGSQGVSDDDAVRLAAYMLTTGPVQTSNATPSLALFDRHTGQPNVGLPMTCAATSAQVVNIPDVDHAPDMDFTFVRELDALTPGFKTVSCLTVPVLRDSSGYVMGVLQLFNALDSARQPIPFDSETVLMAQALASQAAVAISNHLLVKQHLLLVKLENDINIGRGIQQSFLPSVMPEVPGVKIAARFRPAREVAGDFYDVFTMMNNRKLGFFIADVTDKGVGAALFMALTRSLLRAFAIQNRNINWADTLFGDENGTPSGKSGRGGSSRLAISANALKTAVVSTNDYITEFHLDLNMFATMFFGMLDPNTGSLFYINGGHCPPYLLDRDGQIKERLEASGPALGMFPGAEFEIMETQLEHGNTLFMYTDGCTDVRNPSGKFFTENGLTSLVTLPSPSPKDLLERVDNTLLNFMRDAAQFDDVTMLALSRE